jgi:hypothetical protein
MFQTTNQIGFPIPFCIFTGDFWLLICIPNRIHGLRMQKETIWITHSFGALWTKKTRISHAWDDPRNTSSLVTWPLGWTWLMGFTHYWLLCGLKHCFSHFLWRNSG